MVVNFDESGVQSKSKKAKVLGHWHSIVKRVAVPDFSVSMHISLVGTVRARGLLCRMSMFILYGAHVSADSSMGDADDYCVISTKSGGMEGYAWDACCECWASIAQGDEIVLVDGHSSHGDLLANDKLAGKRIAVVALDPNCTRIYQVGALAVTSATCP